MVSGLDIANFRYLQNVNQIEVNEREIPSEKQLIERWRERLSIKVEQEVRAIPEAEREDKVDRWIPIVESLASSEEGRRELAAVCAAYLREHRPQTAVPDADIQTTKSEPYSSQPSDKPRRKRKRRRRKSSAQE